MMRWIFVYCLPFVLFAKDPTICLNMIVKNESRVIRRCLDSIKPYIDYWVIIDTGSDDGTQEIVRHFLRDIPGELYERPWKNFAFNRTEAFALARHKGDYVLLIDADDFLQVDNPQEWTTLDLDMYNMWRGDAMFSYERPQIIRGNLPWRWVGVTHEYLTSDEPFSMKLMEGIRYICGDGGHRSQGDRKFWENISLLEQGLIDEPNNERYIFYLAESYRDVGNQAKALELYQQRVNRGGWDEEVFYSLLQIGRMLQGLGLAPNIVAESYRNAHEFRPHRVEPFYYLAELWSSHRKYEEAYACLQEWEDSPIPFRKDMLFNENWISDYGMLCQKSIVAYYVGKYQEALDACDVLLANPSLPEGWRQLTEQNRLYPLAKLEELKQPLAAQ